MRNSDSKKDLESTPLISKVDQRGINRLILSRPAVRNAFDEVLVDEFVKHLKYAKNNDYIRVLVIESVGETFSAGADLTWMKRMADSGLDENIKDARKLANMLHMLNILEKPVIAKVQGSAFGGGVGLIAASDIAIASSEVKFSLPEVRLGLIPATIAPYVIDAIGRRASSRLFLSGETFSAEEAKDLGLVHECVSPEKLDLRTEGMINDLLMCAPKAVAEAKKLIHYLSDNHIKSKSLIEETARRIAKIRSSDEAREGINSFLEKRPANWTRIK
ncbi:MAG: hypothetical protein CMF70_04835 [Magnetovibrio sp.]|nr:hypothetical protein [Magnetovibrio sp.]